jgi:hypothetical protein
MRWLGTLAMVSLAASSCAHVPCSLSSEGLCKASQNCQPMYSPSACGPGPNPLCTADLVYRGCAAIPKDEQAWVERAFEQCRDIDGASWSSADEAAHGRPKNGRCVCADRRPAEARLADGELRRVARASESGIASNDGRQLDEGVVLSPTGRTACLSERAICELNHGRWKSPDAAAPPMGVPPCDGVTLLREGESTVVVDTRARR